MATQSKRAGSRNTGGAKGRSRGRDRRRSSGGESESTSNGGARRSAGRGGSGGGESRQAEQRIARSGNRGGSSRRETTVLEVVRDNPVPALMIGAGVAGAAWLLIGGGRRPQFLDRAWEAASESVGDVAGRVGGRFAAAAGTVREVVSDAADRAGETFEEAAEVVSDRMRRGAEQVGRYARGGWSYAQEGVSTVGEALRGGASALGEGAQRGYEYGRETLAEAWESHPIAVGVGVLAVGLAAGLLLPRTRREDEMMGRASDEVSREVRKAGKDLLKRGRRTLSSTGNAIAAEVKREGLTGNELRKKVKRIATRAKEVVVATAEGKQ